MRMCEFSSNFETSELKTIQLGEEGSMQSKTSSACTYIGMGESGGRGDSDNHEKPVFDFKGNSYS